MTDKEMQARKRLAKKLTALRKTLRKDERDILDRLVAKPDAEVEGHEMLAASSGFTIAMGAYSAETAVE